jgi:hypothetical protein
MGVGNGVAVAVGMTNGACETGVIPIGGTLVTPTGGCGPTGVETIGPGPGDPQADNTAKIRTVIPAISNRREGFILSSKKRASSTYPNRQRGL